MIASSIATITRFLAATCIAVVCTAAAATVDKVEFSSTRGFYTQPFSVALGCDTPGAEIRYTTNGDAPTATTGAVYSAPVAVNGTAMLRAAGFKAGLTPSVVATHTFIFVADVIQQSPNGEVPPGFPPHGVNGQYMNYGMDPAVTGHPQWGPLLDDALLAIPSVSIVTGGAHLFDPATGIYVNAQERPDGAGIGDNWERPASIELLYPPGIAPPAGRAKGFQENGGIRIRGNYSRYDEDPKHGLKVLFKKQYGAAKLDYPLFGHEGPPEIDRFDLRTMTDQSWAFLHDAGMHAMQDPFGRILMRDLGQPYTRGFFVHLYLNGQYWGLYNIEERPVGGFGEAYLGGHEDDYDVLKVDATTDPSYQVRSTSGTNAAWASLHTKAVAGFETNSAYFEIQGRNTNGTVNLSLPVLVDMTNLIDYMVLNFYTGNHDGPISADLLDSRPNNFFSLRDRKDRNRRGFVTITHDLEGTLLNVNENRHISSTVGSTLQFFNPQWLHIRLLQNTEYKVRFGDRVHRAFFNNGPCTVARSQARFQTLANEIDLAIIAESARWGDSAGEPALGKTDWLAAVGTEQAVYFPQRSAIALTQFQTAGLYPVVKAPVFSQHGGAIPGGGLALTMSDANTGTRKIYYTTDGSDPRAITGVIAGFEYTGALALPGGLSKTVKARVRTNVGVWSALNEALFSAPANALRVTELMYHPAAPSPAETTAGYADEDEFEFIELQNTGATPLSLLGCRLTSGVDFAFGDVTLAPGAFIVIARNSAALLARHSVAAAGQYLGDLDNAGEHITLVDALGNMLLDFDYADGWFEHTDGDGFSLVARDPAAAPIAWQSEAGWRASDAPGGSAGVANPTSAAPGTIVFNEVLTVSQGGLGRWIELRNTSAQTVSIAGWFLSDDAANLAKYRFPAGLSIAGNGTLLVFENTSFGSASADPGKLVAFSLSEHGGDLWLCSDAAGQPGGTRAHVDFGPAESGASFGRHIRSDGGSDFPLLTSPTLGATNTAPRIGPVVISEIMYHPLAASAEFIELRNVTGAPIALDGWRLTGGIAFTIPPGTTLAPHGYAIVTGGDAAAFRAAHSIPAAIPVLGPWDGVLDNDGEQAELKRPLGNGDFLSVDRANFSEDAPWPPASGDGHSLARQPVRSHGNDSINWLAITPTPGAANTADTDGDGLPEAWEIAHALDPSNDDTALDADGDSSTNGAEFAAHTDPRDPASVFRITSAVRGGSGAAITFTAQPGITYTVQFRDSLTAGDWQKLGDVPVQPTAMPVTVVDPAAVTVRFYRVVTPAVP